MPKIQEYGTQVGFQATSMPSTGGLQYRGNEGAALAGLGNTIGNIGDKLYARKEQEETSDLNARFAELSADLTVEIDEKTRDGTIDAQKYAEEVNKRVDAMSQDISTYGGRSVYERNAARLKAQAFKRAARGQAAVAGAKAQQNLITELNSYAMSTLSDPGEFQTNFQAMASSIDDQVRLGTLKPDMAAQLKRKVGKDLAQSAIRGWTDLNPDLGEKRLKSGEFKGLLDEDDMARMQSYVNQRRRANEVEARRVEAAEKRARKAAEDAFIDKNIEGIMKGTLDTDTILKSSALRGRSKMQLINLVDKNAKNGGGVSNPRVKNRITEQILSGEITDVTQFVDQVGNGINVKDLGELNKLLVKTPEGEAMREGEKQLFDLARKTIGNTDTGGTDANSEYNISRFMYDYNQAKQDMIKEGKNPKDLVNPNSKDYFGFRAKTYKLSPQQTLEHQAKIKAAQETARSSGKKMITVERIEDGKLFQMPEENWGRVDKNKFRRK